MSRKASPKGDRTKQKRLSPDDRRKEFVAKATEFFADEGFDGGTRDLARRLGVTQPLLYRYFPSKDDLIKEVYRTVYLDPQMAAHLSLLGLEGARYQPVVCRRGARQDFVAYHQGMPPGIGASGAEQADGGRD
jgi:AcrR family transcriptional regulator